MDGFALFVLLNGIAAMIGRWKGNSKRLSAVKCCFQCSELFCMSSSNFRYIIEPWTL